MALMQVAAESIIFPKSVEKIEINILYEAKTKKIEIGSNIKEINLSAFNGANSLSEVIIHKNKNDIKGSPWGNVLGDRAIFWVGE